MNEFKEIITLVVELGEPDVTSIGGWKRLQRKVNEIVEELQKQEEFQPIVHDNYYNDRHGYGMY